MNDNERCAEWWEIPDAKGMRPDEFEAKQRHRAITILSDTARIEERQYAWHQLNLWNSTLYTNRQLVGFRWGASIDDQAELWPANLRTENLIENIGQTMLAKAASSPLRPTLVPHGASWKTAKAVRLGDRFIFGLWRQTASEDASLAMFNDAYTAGLGCLQVAVDPGPKPRVVVESVFFDNVVIDNRECANRATPRTYRIRKAVHISAINSLYKKKLKPKGKQYLNNRPQGKEWEIIVELWRLPDADGKNGYHGVICCDEIIHEEEWTETWVPLVFLHWQDRQSGFFTKGGVEQVIPYQVMQNELNDVIKENQEISCRAGVMAPASTQFDWSQWYSKAGRVLLYHGMAPTELKLSTNLEELYAERERNKTAAYSHMGLSEMFAMGDMPAPVRFDSSAGLREARNMEDARHLRLWRAYEVARLELARTLLRVVARMDKAGGGEGPGFTAIYKPYGGSFAGKEITYESIRHLNENDYEWEMAPASLAQMSPAARREQLAAWVSRGQSNAGAGQATQMQTNPDIELIERMELASEEDIERHLEILESGEYEKPDFMTNFSKGMMMVTENYHRLLRYADVKKSDKMIQNHQKWVIECASAMAEAAQQEQQAPQMQQSMAPYQPTQGMAGTSSAVA